jgi:Domain of unknown function (DUF1877)
MYFSITKEYFLELSKTLDDSQVNNNLVDECCLDDSEMGFEYIIMKIFNNNQGRFNKIPENNSEQKIITTWGETAKELFSPSKYLGEKIDIDSPEFLALDENKQMELFESGGMIFYLSPDEILKSSKFLNQIEEELIISNYNSKEFNDKGIYPSIWHDDNSENMVFNLRELLEILRNMKTFFSKASESSNYVIVRGISA